MYSTPFSWNDMSAVPAPPPFHVPMAFMIDCE